MPFYNPEIYDKNIISSRVRLARNLNEYFFDIKDVFTAKEVVKKVSRALAKVDDFKTLYLSNMSERDMLAYKENYILSQKLLENYQKSAIILNADESVSIMVNEEDHLREQCFMQGFRLKEAYKRLSLIDDELSKSLNFAFDEELGFLTACPTNLGTGLRASVMLFLPALTESGEISGAIREIEKLGLTLRGAYGEGSKAEGYTYQISNEVTLGLSEYDIIESVEEAVTAVCEAERKMLNKYYSGKLLETTDRVKRAYGILTNAGYISYEEFLELMASVKLGVCLDILKFRNAQDIDGLINSVKPANICKQLNRELSSIERDVERAAIVSKKLIKIKG